MKIDVHNHFFPLEYVKELEKRTQSPTVEHESSGRTLIHYSGDYNIVEDAHTNPETRIREMDRCEVDMQVLSLTTPGIDCMRPDPDGISLAKIVNDAFSVIVEKYPERFSAFAALPMLDVSAAIDELERSITTLGLRGATIFSNVDGKHLDAPEFWPLYEKACKLDVPLYMHPQSPSFASVIEDYRLVPLLGFTFDTTISISRMVFSGVFEKYPNLKVILSHAGGTMPYLVERLDNGYRAYSESKQHIKKPPSEYLKLTYLDTVSFYPPALKCAYEFAGSEHLCLGSDFPHQIGDLKRAVTSIEDLGLPGTENILGGNAAKLLKL